VDQGPGVRSGRHFRLKFEGMWSAYQPLATKCADGEAILVGLRLARRRSWRSSLWTIFHRMLGGAWR